MTMFLHGTTANVIWGVGCTCSDVVNTLRADLLVVFISGVTVAMPGVTKGVQQGLEREGSSLK